MSIVFLFVLVIWMLFEVLFYYFDVLSTCVSSVRIALIGIE